MTRSPESCCPSSSGTSSSGESRTRAFGARSGFVAFDLGCLFDAGVELPERVLGANQPVLVEKRPAVVAEAVERIRQVVLPALFWQQNRLDDPGVDESLQVLADRRPALSRVVLRRVCRKVNYVPDATPDMSTAVKMDEETKSKLEELQAEIKLKTGKKVTQQEVLSRLVESVCESRSEFIDSFRDTPASLSDDELAQFNEGMIASGVETDEEDIDDILYG